MKLSVDYTAGSCILSALLLLVIPPPWLAGALLAGMIHECCHVLAVLAAGGRILSIRITATGTKMEATPMLPVGELFSILAGPAGSFLLVLLYRRYPVLSLCALVQGIYNLLPVYPLDGGRALRCLTRWIAPGTFGESLCRWAERLTLTLIFVAGIWGTVQWRLGFSPVVWGMLLLYRTPGMKKILHYRASSGTIDPPYIMR